MRLILFGGLLLLFAECEVLSMLASSKTQHPSGGTEQLGLRTRFFLFFALTTTAVAVSFFFFFFVLA
jgi:hypothetical protein